MRVLILTFAATRAACSRRGAGGGPFLRRESSLHAMATGGVSTKTYLPKNPMTAVDTPLVVLVDAEDRECRPKSWPGLTENERALLVGQSFDLRQGSIQKLLICCRAAFTLPCRFYAPRAAVWRVGVTPHLIEPAAGWMKDYSSNGLDSVPTASMR